MNAVSSPGHELLAAALRAVAVAILVLRASLGLAQAANGPPSDATTVVKDLYASFGRGDLQHVDQLIAPDVTWVFHGPQHLIPYAGVFKGKEGVRDFFSLVSQTIDVRALGQRRFIVDGDTVAVVGWEDSVVRDTGGEFRADWLHLFAVKDGRITAFDEFTDSAAIVEAFAQPDPARGRAHFTACAGCHGTAAQGNPGMHAPNLTGLSAQYLVRQLRNFAHDVRGGPQDFYGWQMNGRAKSLPDDRALRDVVAYVGTLPRARSVASLRGNTERGKALYQNCAGCHGDAAEGKPGLSAPALAGLDDWYQLEQLESFRTGKRGTHKDDLPGAQMRAAARVLPAEDALRDVLAYIMTLP